MDYFLPFAQERRSCGRALGSLAGNVDGGEGLVQARLGRRDFPPRGKRRYLTLMVRRRASAVSNHVARPVPFILRDAAFAAPPATTAKPLRGDDVCTAFANAAG